MAFIKDSVGQGGKNAPADVQVVKWMLTRAQNNYGTNLFTATYNFQETGIIDAPTMAGIRDVIAYRIRNSGVNTIPPPPPPLSLPGGLLIFPNAAIAPDDDNYIYLLKCSIKPICFNENNRKIDFNDDPLAIQAITGKLNFQGFKNAVIAKDGNICGESDTNYCGVNPVTGTPGINTVASGILGELRPGEGGDGRFRERSGGDHDGIDIRAPVGTPIYAFLGGVVEERIEQTDGFGNRVILKHDGGLFSHYAHLKSFAPGLAVKAPRMQVTQGQLIGYAGKTGNAKNQKEKEDHVHFGISVSARPGRNSPDWRNPTIYLNKCVFTTKSSRQYKKEVGG